MNAKEAIELWYGCDTIEALSQYQIADMLNALVSRVEKLEAAQQSVHRIGYQTAIIPCPHCGVNVTIDSDSFIANR